MRNFCKILNKVSKKAEATVDELIVLLNAKGSQQKKLFEKALLKKEKLYGNKIFVRLCIEASNICRNSCFFCGMTRDNKELERYNLSVKKIKQIIELQTNEGIDIIQLSSGEGLFYNINDLVEIISHAKKYRSNITIGVGYRNYSDYLAMKKAGVTNYLLKFETSDSAKFRIIRPETTLAEHLNHLEYLKSIGYRIGSGNIVGLPNHSARYIAKDLLLMKKLNLYMAESSVFCPTKGSKYEKQQKGDIDLTLNCVALTRLLNCAPLILASSSLGNRITEAFKAGANYISIHAAPENVFHNYAIYGGTERMKIDEEQLRKIVEK